jgi:hypothetical protein
MRPLPGCGSSPRPRIRPARSTGRFAGPAGLPAISALISSTAAATNVQTGAASGRADEIQTHRYGRVGR